MNHDPGHADRLSRDNASLIQERTALREQIAWLRGQNIRVRKERLRLRLRIGRARTVLKQIEYHTLKHGELINRAIEILK